MLHPIISKNMNVLMAAAEAAPFTPAGSFSEYITKLSTTLNAHGHQVSLILPYYRSCHKLRNEGEKIRPTGLKLSVPVGNASLSCDVLETRTADGLQVFFIRRDEFFDRSGIYGSDDEDYQDNAARFIFFSRAVLELAKRAKPTPDIIHGHDWPCGLIPVFGKHSKLPFRQFFSVHDLHFQGNFWSHDFALTQLPASYFSPEGVEFFGSMNFLKSGILFADKVLFQSELLAHEAQTSGQGVGLEPLLSKQSAKLSGIPTGLEDSVWNPAKDTQITTTFSARNISGKSFCRAATLKAFDLLPQPQGPVIYYAPTSRNKKNAEAAQNFAAALDHLLVGDNRILVLGTASDSSTTAFTVAARKYKGKFTFLPEATDEQKHPALAGSDIFLNFALQANETDSLIKALRYGLVPMLLSRPGLFQFATDVDSSEGNAFLSNANTPAALADTCQRAEKLFQNPKAWNQLVSKCLAKDFSWEATAKQHSDSYSSL
ncbi:MAG: glycogen synthase [Chthoniobacterales bacterium]